MTPRLLRIGRPARPRHSDYEVALPILLGMFRGECSRPRLRENVETWGPGASRAVLAAIDRIDDYFPKEPKAR